MKKRFLSNVKLQILFLVRNRLLLVLAFFFSVMPLFFIIPFFLFTSANLDFDFVRTLVEVADGLIFLILLIAAAMSLDHHKRQRLLKMVFTRPCSAENYLAANLAALLFVGSLAYLLLFAGGCAFLFWKGVPFPTAFPVVILNKIFSLAIALSWVLLLGTFIHPALVLMAFLFLNEQSFYQLAVVAKGVAQTLAHPWGKLAARTVSAISHAIYVILPSFVPLRRFQETLERTYRWEDGTGAALLYIFAYTLATVIFCHRTASAILRRQEHS
ncbi:MAG: hypothetical protein D6679_14150 [Candidatus Hydrogenedentota bacterium]|nr:MAG: hypothetical protein D6679_14150 [Candidatus Hydrogenedentota bacterium]